MTRPVCSTCGHTLTECEDVSGYYCEMCVNGPTDKISARIERVKSCLRRFDGVKVGDPITPALALAIMDARKALLGDS